MKIAYSKICINPSFPIKQRGFIQQVNPVYNFHDDLHARILAFDDGEKIDGLKSIYDKMKFLSLMHILYIFQFQI